MSFAQLLADLDTLSTATAEGDTIVKSMAAEGDDDGAAAGADDGAAADDGAGAEDDAAIAAAAADGEAAGEAADAGEGEGDEPLTKSFRFSTDDGEEVEAVDATDLLKSLVERVESNETDMGKAVGMLTDLVKSQVAELGALRSEVSRLGSVGRGRKAVVTIADKPGAGDLAKSLPGEGEEGITANDFMAKAMDACTAGKITGLEVARCESYLNRGLDVPANIKTKVLG